MNIQVKKIVFTILVLFAANSWADEEFPIELTCELGPLIMYLNVTENPDTTWWQNHSSNRHHVPHWDYEEKKDRNPVRSLVINKDNIFFDKRYGIRIF